MLDVPILHNSAGLFISMILPALATYLLLQIWLLIAPLQCPRVFRNTLVASLCTRLPIPMLVLVLSLSYAALSFTDIPTNTTVLNVSESSQSTSPTTTFDFTSFNGHFPSPTPICPGRRNPFAIAVLARDFEEFFLLAKHFDAALKHSDIEDKYRISYRLRLLEVFGEKSDPALAEYAKRAITFIDRILSSSTFTNWKPRSHSVLFERTSTRNLLTLLNIWTDEYKCERNGRLPDVVSNDLRMLTLFHRRLGPYNNAMYQLMNALDIYLDDLSTILNKDGSTGGRRWITDDWTFMSFSFADNDADDALLARLDQVIPRLKRSLCDVRGHLDFLQAVIDDLGSFSLDTLCMDGHLSIEADIASLADGYIRLQNELKAPVGFGF